MKIQMYKCENCGSLEKHIDMYNDQFCYECIDLETGQLKEKCNGCGRKQCECGKTHNELYSGFDNFQDRL